jgi:hypothetical protein
MYTHTHTHTHTYTSQCLTQLVKQLSKFLAFEDGTNTLLDVAVQPIGPVVPILKTKQFLLLLELCKSNL